MKKVLYIPLTMLLACGWACSNKNALPAPTPLGPSEPLAWTPGYDVYIVGMDSGYACYWKNGVKTELSASAMGMGICLDGSDVYVAGLRFLPDSTMAALWKNGVEEDLSGTASAAYQVLVNGGDVYVAGTLEWPPPQFHAVYWKNGQVVHVDRDPQSWAWGVAVSGQDVYVMGALGSNNTADTMLLWKNGVRNPTNYAIDSGYYQQIFFSGPDLYLVGLQGYSVNGMPFVDLPGAVQTNGMFLSGSDVYVAGVEEVEIVYGMQQSVYWKNGQMIVLPDPGGTGSAPAGIAVAGSDVYVIGGGSFWKNEIRATLTRDGALNQILVVKR